MYTRCHGNSSSSLPSSPASMVHLCAVHTVLTSPIIHHLPTSCHCRVYHLITRPSHLSAISCLVTLAAHVNRVHADIQVVNTTGKVWFFWKVLDISDLTLRNTEVPENQANMGVSSQPQVPRWMKWIPDLVVMVLCCWCPLFFTLTRTTLPPHSCPDLSCDVNAAKS